jgi:glycosyltransferase involved in cell wall biosynthesis
MPGAYEDPARAFAPPAPDPELTLGLARLARRFRPDVVHAHTWSAYSWLPVSPAIGAPLVVTLHEHGLVCAKKSLVYEGRPCTGPGPIKCVRCAGAHYGPGRGALIAAAELVGGPVLRAATSRFIAVSRAVAERSGLAGRCEVIPNFLPEDGFEGSRGGATLLGDADANPDSGAEPTIRRPESAADRIRGRVPDEPFILFVGALGGHKGIHVLLDAYRRLVQPPPLVCIGHRWADTPTELPAGVSIHEDWPNDLVRAAWARCLFGVIPSTWPEPFAIVALEAMAAGRAVVASRIGGLPEVVRDGETGLLVPPGDPVALAAALDALLADPALRSWLGGRAAAAAVEYRAGQVVPRIEAVYAAALASAGTHVRSSRTRERP